APPGHASVTGRGSGPPAPPWFQPAAPYWAGRPWVVALLAGVLSTSPPASWTPGSLLEQPGRQQDVGAHLEELALPVLEGRLDERPAGQVCGVGLRGLVMLLVVVVVGAVSR